MALVAPPLRAVCTSPVFPAAKHLATAVTGSPSVSWRSTTAALALAATRRHRSRTARRAEGRPVSVLVEQTDRHDLSGMALERSQGWVDQLMVDIRNSEALKILKCPKIDENSGGGDMLFGPAGW